MKKKKNKINKSDINVDNKKKTSNIDINDDNLNLDKKEKTNDLINLNDSSIQTVTNTSSPVTMPADNLLQKYDIGDDAYAHYEDIKSRKKSSNKMFFSIIIIALLIGGGLFGGLFNGLREFKFTNHYIFVPKNPSSNHNYQKSLALDKNSFNSTKTNMATPKIVYTYDLGNINNKSNPNNILDYQYYRSDITFQIFFNNGQENIANIQTGQTPVLLLNILTHIPGRKEPQILHIASVVKITDWNNNPNVYSSYNAGFYIYQGRLPDGSGFVNHKYLVIEIFSSNFGDPNITDINPFGAGINMTFWSYSN